MDDGFLVGQELNFPVSTTVEIKIPYPYPAQPYLFNIQLFAPTFKHGSRVQNGMQVTPGRDAWEIEFQVKPEHIGKYLSTYWDTWLLAVVWDSEYFHPGFAPNLEATIVACQNREDAVLYPVDGECIELQKPPDDIPDEQLYTTGNVRIFSPAGFSPDKQSCNASCMTKAKKDDGTAVAAMISYAEHDDRWVALKGGQFDISGSNIDTTSDVRLIMVDYSQAAPITLPVLRGDFQVNATSGRMTPTSAPADTYLLVGSPLHAQDDGSSWSYKIELAQDRMIASGPLQRVIEPTEGDPTTFDFNADWSITARGGVDLQGGASVQSISPDQFFSVGTLIVTPSGADYTMEHDPRNADATLPAVMPKFEHIRMAGATLSQPASLGGAQVPVQAVILPPGISVYEGLEQITLRCGTHCFDLRGEADAMTATGPNTVREYRMPDLIIQDQAGTVMFNTPQGVEIYSRDHPMSRLGLNGDDYSFSYETFGGSVSTYEGECPVARDPLAPPGQNTQGGTGPTTTIISGTATMSLPNAESTEGGGQEIGVHFTLCENSLREMSFWFSSGDATAIPLGNSGLFMNFVGGTISLSPGQGSQSGHTTVRLDVQLRGMSPDTTSSTVFILGVVTIDSRGLLDMQLQAGVKVFGDIGVGATGHFWVAWAPLDLGFEVQACVPYDKGFDPGGWLGGKRCDGNELLFGSLRAHLWEGQGWQNQYHWLPDNDDLHIAARYEVSINIPAGIIVDWEFIVIPPEDIQLGGIKLAFGEFCTNDACTAYEWGVMGAYNLLGYDFGMYYGFDSGLDFILGSADYVLIDEAGQVYGSANQTVPRWRRPDQDSYIVTIQPGVPSAMFGLGWDSGDTAIDVDLRLQAPGGAIIDRNSVLPGVTVTVSPTVRGWQTIIVIDSPEAGDWDVYITSGEPQLPDHNFVYFANNPAPSLTLSGIPDPSQRALKPGETVKIEWTSNISDVHNGWLSLYYTVTSPITSTQTIVGPIVERLPLKKTGTYEWEVQGLAFIDDFYHVFARIDSNVAAAVNACGEDHQYNPDPTASESGCAMLNRSLVLPEAEILDLAKFTYVDFDPPNTPILVGAEPANWTGVVVLWQPNSDVDLAGYLVRCAQGPLVRTVRTAAVHTSDTMLQESAQVNGLHPNQAATCSVRAYDTSGNISGSSSSATVWPENTTSQAIIEPQSGGALLSPNGKITAVFPPQAVEVTTRVRYTRRPAPPHPIGPLQYAGASFDLSAFGPGGDPVTEFKTDFALEALYEDSDWQEAGIAGEDLLNLYWWDGGAWQGLLPCDGCAHDTDGNRFTVLLDHLSEFALLGGTTLRPRLYLPLLAVTGLTPEPTRTPTPTVTARPTNTLTPTPTPTARPTTGADAFVHTATTANITRNWTEFDHPLTNNNPNAIVHVTQNWNPGGSSGQYNNHSIGVWYRSTTGRWVIFNQDLAAMPTGAGFNVLIPATGSDTFVHAATAANITENWTYIDHPLTNDNPNAIVLVTQNWNPGGTGGTYNNHPIGVWYAHGTKKWAVFNQDLAAMPVGAAFNVLIPTVDTSVFVHIARAGNISGNYTLIDHPLTNNAPNAIVLVTQNWNPSGVGNTYNNHPIGVWYSSNAQKWSVFNQDLAAMPVDAAFNVLVTSADTAVFRQQGEHTRAAPAAAVGRDLPPLSYAARSRCQRLSGPIHCPLGHTVGFNRCCGGMETEST